MVYLGGSCASDIGWTVTEYLNSKRYDLLAVAVNANTGEMLWAWQYGSVNVDNVRADRGQSSRGVKWAGALSLLGQEVARRIPHS